MNAIILLTALYTCHLSMSSSRNVHLPLEFIAPSHESALEVSKVPPLTERHCDRNDDDDQETRHDHTDDEGPPRAPAAIHRAAEDGEGWNSR